MFYYLHLFLLAPIYLLVSSLLLRDQDREILLLRQQLLILQRQLGRKPAYDRLEKLALLLATLRLSKRRLAAALLIVRPDMLLRWHRELVRRHWTSRRKRRPGRPPLTEEIQDLVVRLARGNPHWGCRKIQGEMLKLGLKVSRSTVIRLLRRHALGPLPDNGRSLTWSRFLGQYKDFIWACDFFTVTTARLRTFYVLFFMELCRRRLLLFNVTEHPHAEWVVQQLRNLSVQHNHLPRFILHDRDGKFSEAFDTFAEASGTKIIKLPARSPNLNAYAERWVRSVREECLD
jgi:putative transposase